MSITNSLALLSDADGGIDVDITDFDILATNFIPTGASAADPWTHTNFDDDNDVGIIHFNSWAVNFPPGAYGSDTPGQVPEPSTIVSLVLGGLMVSGVTSCRSP